MPGLSAPDLPLLAGYPEALRDSVRRMLAEGRLAEHLARRHPETHGIRNDAALYEHAMAFKQRHLRNAPPLAKVVYDTTLRRAQQALGTLTTVSRVQGSRLKAKHEIRVAALFKDAPAAMLDMIVVHELAHLKERDHDKAFYALCEHMLPGYGQLEFDTRLYLTLLTSAPDRSPP
jgi:predicted metal-dependent hydrolase